MPDRNPTAPDDQQGPCTLERLAPWVVFSMMVAIVILSIVSAVLGAPWWP